MRNLWLRLCCLLTGYNYRILRLCSEASTKSVMRYTSALLILMIIWAFIGYMFADRYVKTDMQGSIVAASIAVFVVIQIERQIMLSVGKNNWAFLLRGLIALIMAVLGSVITDQVIFKDDIERQKEFNLTAEVDSIFPSRVVLIDNLIDDFKEQISEKEEERSILLAEVTANPTINYPTYTTKTSEINDSTETTERTVINQSRPNPKAAYLPVIDNQITLMNTQLTLKEDLKMTLRNDLENELREKVGFLDELKVMFQILGSSTIALVAWAFFFCFFLFIELFILVSKLSDTKNDYEKTIQHQMDIHLKKIENLAQGA